MDNNLLDTDSYKASHWKQYPPKTTSLFSYLESRGGKYPSTLFFGLQYILEKYLSKPITLEQVEEAKAFFECTRRAFPLRRLQVYCREAGWQDSCQDQSRP